MCFSASASFSAGIILTTIGVVTIRKTQHPSQLMFACIPLIFGVQQISEGILWLTLPDLNLFDESISTAYIYLFFAQIVWPIWTPISILLLEKNPIRKKILRIFVGSGILVAGYLTYCLFTYSMNPEIVEHHIVYNQNNPFYARKFVILFYGAATIASTIFSSNKKMWLLGITILISYLISYFFYNHYVLSVWCFFSSLISLSVYYIIRSSQQKLRT